MLGFGKEVETNKFELLSSVFTTWCLLDARKSFLAAAVPVRLKGIRGARGPPYFQTATEVPPGSLSVDLSVFDCFTLGPFFLGG